MNTHCTVVIVNFNAGDSLMTCLRSIYETGMNPSVVIVDNASRDGSLERCRSAYPKATYIVNSHNLGFAAGANIGAQYALERHAKSIIFMNPDATIEKSCLQKLVDVVAREDVGIAVPLIYRTQDKSIWFSGGEISHARQRAVHVHDMPRSKVLRDVGYATGCVMAVSAEVFLYVGMLDEQFFLYYEDVDFSLRTLEKELRVVVVPDAYAWHAEHSEDNKPQKTYFLVFSGLLFFRKHAKGRYLLWQPFFTFLRGVYSDMRGLFSRGDMTSAVKRAFKDYRHARKTTHLRPYR